MALSVIEGDLLVRGTFTATNQTVAASSVGNTQVNSVDPIDVAKLKHRQPKVFSQVRGTGGATERRAIHVAYAAGTILSIKAGLTVAVVGAASHTIDILKNGVSILSSTLTLNSGNAAYTTAPCVIATASYVAGDVFEVSVVAATAGGTVGQGLIVEALFDELPV